jgi:hypothetical protein|tara:strand:- start:2347 stop:2580 length:234 start_codon:yes stop_codon:yes gene_type:complete
MSSEDQRFFDDCRSLFLTDGWKHFQNEINVALQSLNLGAINSSEEFWKAKGKFETLLQVAGWENAVLAAEQQSEDSE